METTLKQSYCEVCGSPDAFTPAADDRTEGQLCPKCQTEGVIIRITCSINDDEPRYQAGLENAVDYLEQGMVYGSYSEFNDDEWEAIGNEWNKMPDLDGSSIEALQTSIDRRTAFLQDFWKRHFDILVRRDTEMNEWPQIKAGGQKPIIWTDVPDFRIIVEEVR